MVRGSKMLFTNASPHTEMYVQSHPTTLFIRLNSWYPRELLFQYPL